MLIKRLLFKRILILLQNSICGIIDAYSYGRKATPQNGRVSSALSVSKEKGPDLFQSPTFCAGRLVYQMQTINKKAALP